MGRTLLRPAKQCPTRLNPLRGAGGSSGVEMTETKTVPIEQTDPSMKDPTTQYGMPEAIAPVISDWKTNKEMLAKVMPKPVKNDWAKKPLAS